MLFERNTKERCSEGGSDNSGSTFGWKGGLWEGRKVLVGGKCLLLGRQRERIEKAKR